jgi:hypothetical protein
MTSQMSNQIKRIRQISEDIKQLRGTPLVNIGAELERTLDPLLVAGDGDVTGPVNHLVEHLNDLMSTLPKTFGQRFMFDAALVLALMEEWNPKLKLRRLALPGYDPRWGYRRLALPSLSRESTLVFDLFLLPGRDALDNAELLDYPWLMHEMGHCLLHLHPSEFPDAFRVGLESHFKNLRLLAAADRGRTREKAAAALRQAEQFWTPAEDQHDWAHEIAFDVFALWTCGPAFLSAFQNTLGDLSPDPFIKKQDHPPYVVRVAALINAAKKLRFDGYLSGLSDTYRNQCRAVEEARKKNDLLLFSPDNLIQDCVDAAVSVARNFELRRWREVDPDRFLAEPSFGSDLFAAAFKKSQISSSNYAEWQQGVLGKLAASVTL